MLPRWHIFFGAMFCIVIYVLFPSINFIYLGLIFLSSFLIDFDHYICAVSKTRKIGLFDAFKYHKELGKREKEEVTKGIRNKSDFHIFHTIEFHILIAILGILWTPLFYVFLGLVFHSLLDVFSMLNEGVLHKREFFFFNWVRKKI